MSKNNRFEPNEWEDDCQYDNENDFKGNARKSSFKDTKYNKKDKESYRRQQKLRKIKERYGS